MFNNEYIIKPLVNVDFDKLYKLNIKNKDILRYFPKDLLEERRIKHSSIKRVGVSCLLRAVKWSVKIFLRPRKEPPGKLDKEEIRKVYQREARTYNIKHALTTRGNDTNWRRQVGFYLADQILESEEPIKILDLCTGTGQTIFESKRALARWAIKGSFVGIDYSEEMIQQALAEERGGDIIFTRGDATNLTKDQKQASEDLAKFDLETFDFVTQMFGIGGIDNPISCFKEVLRVLKVGGYYYFTDMHRPIGYLPGEWHLFFKKIYVPLLEARCYEEVTVPLALKVLWAWRDTTVLFYVAPLITVYDGRRGKYFGFKKVHFEYEVERWWFGLPLVPVARILLKKIEISKEEARKRQSIFSACKWNW